MGWKKGHNGNIPANAVIGGYDSDGSPLYVGRAHHRGDVIPGKINPRHRVMYFAYGGAEHHTAHYEILKNSAKYHWIRSRGGAREAGAVKGGRQSDGTKLYIGRAQIQGATAIGKIHPKHHCLYVSYAGVEHPVHEYEALVKTHRRGPPQYPTGGYPGSVPAPVYYPGSVPAPVYYPGSQAQYPGQPGFVVGPPPPPPQHYPSAPPAYYPNPHPQHHHHHRGHHNNRYGGNISRSAFPMAVGATPGIAAHAISRRTGRRRNSSSSSSSSD